MIEIRELQPEFIGTGDMKDCIFRQMLKSDNAYLYSITNGESKSYGVFLRKTTKVCVDFEKKIFSENNFKEYYPKSNSFGDWAWCYANDKEAVAKFDEIK